jgi:hypothetical protein
VGKLPNSQPELPEHLQNRGHLLRRARILIGRCSRRYEAELLFAVQKACTLGHKAVLARDPLLDFLIGDAWLDELLFAGIARWALTSSIIIASANLSLRLD